MGTVVTIDIFVHPGATSAQLADVRRILARAQATLHRADEVFST